IARHLVKRHRGDFYMQIYPVQQWATNFIQVALHHTWRANALLFGMIVITAGAWVHAGEQHKVRREIHRYLGTRYSNSSLFKWLSDQSQHRAREFGQLIEKQLGIVGPRYFSRLGDTAPSDECNIRARVARGSIRSGRTKGGTLTVLSSDLMCLGGPKCF